ncbi:hypothetical protein A2U01_0058301, partial [Trifolium medium]|nr:hypothetical protein [Trifolium medium]
CLHEDEVVCRGRKSIQPYYWPLLMVNDSATAPPPQPFTPLISLSLFYSCVATVPLFLGMLLILKWVLGNSKMAL